MKKLFISAMAAVLMVGCSSHDVNELVEPETPAQQLKNHGVTVDCAKTARKVAATPIGESGLVSEAESMMSEAELDAYAELFFTEFPAGGKNLEKSHENLDNYSYNFSMISNGKPFTIYPIIVGGNAHNTLGVYYYEDGEMKTVDVWETEVDGSAGNGWSVLQSGKGITIDLPKNVIYGFYITNEHAYGTSYSGSPFYSDATKNYNNDTHVVTFSRDGSTFIGFEDLTLGAKGCDYDYNDVIFLVTPEQKLIPGIEIDIEEDKFVCESDDFNINLGDFGYEAIATEKYDEPFEFNGKITISNYNPVLNSCNELVFKLRMYNRDAWDESLMNTTVEIDPSKIKNLPDGYTLISATKTYAAESEGAAPYLQVDVLLRKNEAEE